MHLVILGWWSLLEIRHIKFRMRLMIWNFVHSDIVNCRLCCWCRKLGLEPITSRMRVEHSTHCTRSACAIAKILKLTGSQMNSIILEMFENYNPSCFRRKAIQMHFQGLRPCKMLLLDTVDELICQAYVHIHLESIPQGDQRMRQPRPR